MGMQIGQGLAVSLGSIPLKLSAENKVLYHASAVFASNFLVAITGVAIEILGRINMGRSDALRLLSPLIQQTCTNLLRSGPELALTGPASRGDIQTIKRHAKALGNSSRDTYNLYLALTREAILLKVREDPLFVDKAKEMEQEINHLFKE